MISIKNLSKEYSGDVHALKNVNLNIAKGDFVMLLGSSGAGKSTLLRSINRLTEATSGEIFYDGIKVDDKKSIDYVRKNTGMIFQSFNIVNRLSVLQNVLCGRLAYNSVLPTCFKLFKEGDIELALDALDRVGLSDKVYSRADQLSGGQRQRVGIARALVQQPKVILADEPVASLDPVSAAQILDILTEINRSDNITTIISIHNIHLAMKYAKRIVGLKHGEMVFDKDASLVKSEDISLIYEGDMSFESESPVKEQA